MEDDLELNLDLNQEAVPSDNEFTSTYGEIAQPVEIPESIARQGFEGLSATQDASTPLDQDLNAATVPVVTAEDRPVASMMTAISTGDFENPVLKLSRENVVLAQDLLNANQEHFLRNQLATQRQMDTLKHLTLLKQKSQELVQSNQLDPRVAQGLTETYIEVLNQDRERSAKIALEYETIERIQDSLATGDYVEARLISDLHTNGNAEARMFSEISKSLVIAQRMEELETEYKDSGWVRYFANILTSFIPFRSNFDRAGILDDAGIYTSAGGILDFIMSGETLQKQGANLWDLNPEDFAAAMAKDGPIMRAIRDNAGLFINDPGAELSVLNSLNMLSKDDRSLENVFGVADPALVLAGGGSKVVKLLSGMGARSAAADQVAKSLLTAIDRGTDGSRILTGIPLDEALVEASPSAFKASGGVSLSGDIIASLRTADELKRTLPDIVGASKFSSEDEILAAYQAAEKQIKAQLGESVKDVKFVEVDPSTGVRATWAGDVAEGVRLHSVEVTVGKKSGGGFASEAPAKGSLTKFGIDDGTTFKDASGQWFAKFNVAVKEDGFITSPLITPDGNGFNYFRSTARVIDPQLMGKALQSGNAANLFNTRIEIAIKASLKGLSKQEKNSLDQIIRLGQNKSAWYSQPDFSKHYERLTGNLPSDAVFDAYSRYRTISDLTYLFRNDAMYAKKYAEGQRNVSFDIGDRTIENQGIINYNPKKRVTGGIYDADNNRWLDSRLSPDHIKRMRDEGYVLVKLDNPFALPDKRLVRNVMVKEEKLRTSELRRFQLNYSQGGSRAYTAQYFAKQAQKDVDGNLVNPKTFIAGKNPKEMKLWVEDMNAALKLAREGVTDPARYDDIFKGRAGYMGGDEFVEAVEREMIDINNDLEVVFHSEMPSAYRGIDDEGLRFVDLEETAIESYSRSQGQMFYSEKGNHLKDYTGDFAETVDPWQTLNNSIQEIGRVTSFSGYKQNALERFKQTYGQYVKTRDLDSVGSLYEISKAPIKEGLPLNLTRKIKAEQNAIRNILNFETDFEKTLRQQTRQTAEWILNMTGSEKLFDFTHWVAKNNPVQALRSFAFDAKLGLFNVAQLFVQTSTMISATALSPRYGMKGMLSSVPLLPWAHAKYSDNMLDVLAKRGIWKGGGFGTEEEFKSFAKMIKDTGILEVSGNNLAMIHEYGANKIFGISSKKDAFLEAGRGPFYAAEQMNRLVAARIAWGMNIDKGRKIGTAGFRENFMRLTDDYSFNMMSQSSARFQHGLMSIPTQFWGYSFRMMDALLGSRFTPRQKLQLLMANFGMAGAAGVPAGSIIANVYEEWTGEPTSIENVDGWLERGAFDAIAYNLTGADVEIGAKLGTADMLPNLIADLFGMGKYGEKSTMEVVTGATGSIYTSIIPTIGKAIEYSWSEAAGEVPEGFSSDAWIALAREISTGNNIHNASLAAMYGIYKSKSGTLYASNLPPETAFFSALGFQPRQVSAAADLMEKSNEDKVVEEAAKLVTNWRQEAFTIPDKWDTNREKVQAYLALFPSHTRKLILDRAQKIQDPSLFDKLSRKAEEEMNEKQVYEYMENGSSLNSTIEQAETEN